MSVKERLRKLEQAAQVIDNTPICEMSNEQLMQIIGVRPDCCDDELLAIINAEASANGNR